MAKPFKIPFVLEIGRPLGTGLEAQKAAKEFDTRTEEKKKEEHLNEVLHKAWDEVNPGKPYPGIDFMLLKKWKKQHDHTHTL